MALILILHASLGTGHTSAANALGEAFARLPAAEAPVVDTLDFGGALLRTTLTEAYRRVSEKAPSLYRMLYESSDADDPADPGNPLLGLLERQFVDSLEQFVAEAAPDAIVCTHALPARVLQRVKAPDRPPWPIYLVVTDFMPHGAWLTPDAAGYFLPSDLTRDALIARGVTPSLLHVTGIPVPLEVAEPKPAAAMRRRRRLPAGMPLVTLFGGGIDPQRVRRMVTRLLDGATPACLVVVAGRNEALAGALADLSDGPRVHLRQLGLIDYVDDLVAASDLVITKAGGLIVSEVLARGAPLVIIDPLPGQEEWNADFVAAAGAGIQLRMPEMVPPAVLGLLAQPDRLAAMSAHAWEVGRPRAALEIAERVLAELGRPAQPAGSVDADAAAQAGAAERVGASE
jgi:processive 1,2-diacylglycerol beta-glucosyltransferase